MKQSTSHTATETEELGRRLGTKLTGGSIVTLTGNLGAGKTTFTKGIAQGLGVTHQLASPTFTLMATYPVPQNEHGIKTLVHIDAYRLNNEQELWDIGAEDFIGTPHTATIIEWPEKIPGLSRFNTTQISIKHGTGDERTIDIKEENS